MDLRLQITLLCGIFLGGGFIVYLLRKKRLYIKYALAWLLTVVTLVLLALFPEAVRGMAYFFGLKTPVNFIYVVEGAFVLCILLICTVIMSHMNSRIVLYFIFFLKQLHFLFLGI